MTSSVRDRGGATRRWVESLGGYAFALPALVLLGLFVLVPIAGAAVTSLQSTNGFGAGTFVGFGNYSRMFSDGVFWRAVVNTVVLTAIVTPLAMAGGLGTAVLLNSVLPARGLFRTILVLPMAVSGIATALMGVLSFDENSGVVNKFVRALALPTPHWQSEGPWAFLSVVVVTLWWRLGFNMLIYLAGLQSIDPAVREAALLDGAGGWQRFRSVTVPLVRPSTLFLLIMNVIYSFELFDVVYVLTRGGPQNATKTLVVYAYETGFETRDQGYAAAIGIVLLVVMLAFTAIQWSRSRAREEA